MRRSLYKKNKDKRSKRREGKQRRQRKNEVPIDSPLARDGYRNKYVRASMMSNHGVPATRCVHTRAVTDPAALQTAGAAAAVGTQLLKLTSAKSLVGTNNALFDYFAEVARPYEQYLVEKTKIRVSFTNTSAQPARVGFVLTKNSAVAMSTGAEVAAACSRLQMKFRDLAPAGSSNSSCVLSYTLLPGIFHGSTQYNYQDEYSGTINGSGAPSDPATMLYAFLFCLNTGLAAQAANTGIIWSVESDIFVKLYNRNDDINFHEFGMVKSPDDFSDRQLVRELSSSPLPAELKSDLNFEQVAKIAREVHGLMIRRESS